MKDRLMCGLLFESMWSLAGICSLIFSFNRNSATLPYPTVTVHHDRELDLASGLANDLSPTWPFTQLEAKSLFFSTHSFLFNLIIKIVCVCVCVCVRGWGGGSHDTCVEVRRLQESMFLFYHVGFRDRTQVVKSWEQGKRTIDPSCQPCTSAVL